MSPSVKNSRSKTPGSRTAGRPTILSKEQERQLLADPRADPETKRVIQRRIANRGSANRMRQNHANADKHLLDQMQSKCDRLEGENAVLKEQIRSKLAMLGGFQKECCAPARPEDGWTAKIFKSTGGS